MLTQRGTRGMMYPSRDVERKVYTMYVVYVVDGGTVTYSSYERALEYVRQCRSTGLQAYLAW